jgi:DNA-binding transcriptional LysR family regulator
MRLCNSWPIGPCTPTGRPAPHIQHGAGYAHARTPSGSRHRASDCRSGLIEEVQLDVAVSVALARGHQGHRPARRHRRLFPPIGGVDIKLAHGVDNLAMAMSLVASTRGLALMPAYAENLLPESVVSRPLEGEAPTIDLAVGYRKSNSSPILKLFLSRLDELVRSNQKQ